jgi:alkaline phosphatase
MRASQRSVDFPRRRLLAGALLALAAWIDLTGIAAAASPPLSPKNIVILFADGVSATQLEVARYASRHLRNQGLAITDTVLKEGTIGVMTSHAHEALATDSAAAGSAMATGVKTTIGTIAMSPDGRPVRTVMEAAKAKGKRIGLVTTATVYDATPAAFSVHAKSRRDHEGIVDQYLGLEPDVLLGGGSDYFLPAGAPGGKRKDGRDVIAAFRAKGYQVARDTQELRAAAGPRLLGLFAEEDMDHEIDRHAAREPSIAEMTEAALRVLSQDNRNGFVLLLETENTDTAGHRNDIAALIRDLWIFDRAVELALEFYRKAPGETLLLVTGDHETGGLSPTYALKDLSSTSSRNRFYAGPAHLEMVNRITLSLEKAAEMLGKKPSAEALDKLVSERFPGFRLDPDLREAILKQQVLDRNFGYPTQNALARMVSRQTGFYWGGSGHTAQPVVVGALGPGAELFKGYLDNTDFGKILHRLLEGR